MSAIGNLSARVWRVYDMPAPMISDDWAALIVRARDAAGGDFTIHKRYSRTEWSLFGCDLYFRLRDQIDVQTALSADLLGELFA
jgi:hypothetical protein